jgi:hypothetical protein
LEDKATTDKSFRVCCCTETALALMSNQHKDSWEDWMKTNRNRTQEEWIQDGFSKYGVAAHLPPDPSDAEPMLKLIGRKSWNFLQGGPQETNAPEAVPDYVQYNAFRWLRDSGFSPSTFARSNATLAASQDMTIALLKYANWRNAFSFAEGDKLGVLAFTKKSDLDADFGPPRLMKSWVAVLVDSCVLLFLLAGLWLLALRKRKSLPTPDTR